MTFEEAIKQVPEEWTAWELRTRLRKTRFVFTMSKQDAFGSNDVESDSGHGATPADAVLNCISRNLK